MVEGPLVEYHDHLPDRLLRDDEISVETAEQIAESIPPNTLRGYTADRLAFRRWCALVERTPIPATPETAAEYARFLADGGAICHDQTTNRTWRNGSASPATISRALTAIRTEHDMNGFESQPNLRAARAVIKAHRKRGSKAGVREKQARPLTAEEIRAIAEACDTSTLAGARDRALIVLGFAMMARRSELVALNTVSDISESDLGVEVLVRWSKTDQDAVGEKVAIHYGSQLETCPVRSVRAWRTQLQQIRPGDGPLFVSIDQKGRLAGIPGYTGRSTTGRLSDRGVEEILLTAAERAGVDTDGLSAHSLRAGGATEAYKAGADLLSISRRGRWKDGSPVLLRYIREQDKWKNNPMKGVL